MLRLALLAAFAARAAGLRLGSGSEFEDPVYYWPSARGRVSSYSLTDQTGPTDLNSSLQWEWHHPTSRFHIFTLGTLIDDKLNVYLAASDAVRKFNSEGDLLWKWSPESKTGLPTVPCLHKGALYGTTADGYVYALSMLTGKELWLKRVAYRNADKGVVQAHSDMVIVSADAEDLHSPHAANTMVLGLNSNNGTVMWEFKPDAPVWNFLALFVGDAKRQTFVFQDREGRAYRNYLSTGKVKWKNGGRTGSWTDGAAMFGNRMVYTVTLHGCCCGPCDDEEPVAMGDKTGGMLSAYRILDGSLVWKQKVWRPPNVIPAVGKLFETGRDVVVMPIGRQCGPLSPSDLFVFDATTGENLWHMSAGRNPHLACAGDLEGIEYRRSHGLRERCNAASWSAPSIDKQGTIYTGNQDGNFYAIREQDGGGQFVSYVDTGAAFGSPGSAHAPGMVAVTSCDGLFVFKRPLPKSAPPLPTPTTIDDANTEDNSPAALAMQKAEEREARLEPNPEARERKRQEQEQMAFDKMMDKRLAMKENRPTATEAAADAAKRDIEEGDDAGLPEVITERRKAPRRMPVVQPEPPAQIQDI
mmetsp:Transcript_69427/g.214575  ORF Transcript_69427/g.214575 Transcript_69427/m.214575 type:complete len:584 (-) Transcript_69427:95-1846(-)